MMKKVGKISLWMLIAVFSIGLISCEDDNETKELSKEEAKQILTNINTTMQSDFAAMKEAEGVNALDQLSNMQDPFNSGKSNQKGVGLFLNLKSNILPADKSTKAVKSEEPFDFLANVGTYSWNIEYQKWDVAHGQPNDKIIINYPTDAQQTENNVTLTIRDYQEQGFSSLFGTYYEPTSIDADLFINDVKYVAIDLTSEYNSEAQPVDLDAYIYLVPFEFEIGLNEGSTNSSFSSSLLFDDVKILSASLNVIYKDSDKVDVTSLNGHIQYRDVKVNGDIDFEGLENIDTTNITSVQDFLDAVNNEIDIIIVEAASGDKIADLELAIIGEGYFADVEVVLVFNDGTTELAESYFETFFENIEVLLEYVGLTLENNFDDF